MTYNFDPDKWYENEFFMFQTKLKKNELIQEEYDLAVLELDQKIEEMWKRLDGTYQITINWTAITIIPKKPYSDWAISFDSELILN